jgi:hypothetical protein
MVLSAPPTRASGMMIMKANPGLQRPPQRRPSDIAFTAAHGMEGESALRRWQD